MRHPFGISESAALVAARTALNGSAPERSSSELSPVDARALEVEELAVGFANQNWRVRYVDGDCVLKIGPASSMPKWSAGAIGAQRAAQLGVRVPNCRWQGIVDGRVVRLFDWIDGAPASTLIGRPTAQARLGRELGVAIAALHRDVEMPGFTSRLDGSSKSFPSWAGYVEHRLRQIEARAQVGGAPEGELRRRGVALCQTVAADVSEQCRPTLCHRDLHPDNLLVNDDGSLVAVLDWDMPEVWDRAGEWFKLDRFLFAQLPSARSGFEGAYTDAHPPGAIWTERVRLVHVLENLSVIASASSNDSVFVAASIDALRSLLD